MKSAHSFSRFQNTALAAAFVALACSGCIEITVTQPGGDAKTQATRSAAAAANSEELNYALANAAAEGDLNKVKQLLAAGADVNFDGGMPLNNAAEGGHIAIARYLLDNGADIETTDRGMSKCDSWEMYPDPSNALAYAVSGGHEDMVLFLIKNGVKIKECGDAEAGFVVPEPALRIAVTTAEIEGNTRMLRLLLENGARVECTTACGYNSLQLAKKGSAQEVKKRKEAIRLLTHYSKKETKKTQKKRK